MSCPPFVPLGSARQPTELAIVGAGVGGLAAALEAVVNGVDPGSIAVFEARPSTSLQRNIVVDRFMLERLRGFGVAPASLNPWDSLALTISDAAFAAPIVIPALSQLRPSRREATASVDLLFRTPEGVAHLAELNESMRQAAARHGIRIVLETRVLAVHSAAGGGVMLEVDGPGGCAELPAQRVVLACGAGSPLLAKLGVHREPVDIPLQSWLIAVFDGVGRFPVALRVADRDGDGAGLSFSLSSKSQTSITVRLGAGETLREEDVPELGRQAARELGIPGALVEAFVYETRMDRASAGCLGPDCLLLGDALRRSDVTYGGGANSAFADAWWLGRFLAGEIGLEGYLAAVGRTTEALVRGSWSMRMFDGFVRMGQNGRLLWPGPVRQVGDIALNLMTQGLATAATVWSRLLASPPTDPGKEPGGRL